MIVFCFVEQHLTSLAFTQIDDRQTDSWLALRYGIKVNLLQLSPKIDICMLVKLVIIRTL